MGRSRRAEAPPFDPPPRDELLRSVPMFADLEDAELSRLALIGRWRTLERGETLFDEGARGSEMYVIARGRIALHKGNLVGQTFLVERHRGEILGEMALFDDRPRSATAIGQTDSLLLAVSKAEFVACVRKSPGVALGVIANLIDRLRQANDRSTLALSLDVRGRLAHYLLERSRLIGERQIVRPRPIDRRIAEQIGSSRETINRKLTELETLRMIARRPKEIEILDEAGLQRLCGE